MNASLLLSFVGVLFLAGVSSAGEAASLGESVNAFKEKYRDQKKAIAGDGLAIAPSIVAPVLALPAPQAPQSPAPPQPREQSIAELEAYLLRLPDCKTDPEDTAGLAKELRGKIGLVTCRLPGQGLTAYILVPKSVRKEQQLLYAAPPGLTFIRARLLDHYLVLQFDSQTHYLDLNKPVVTGFSLAGYSTEGELDRFDDLAVFTDALKLAKADSQMLAKLPALVSKAAAGEPYGLLARRIPDGWYVVVTKKTGSVRVWPEMKTP